MEAAGTAKNKKRKRTEDNKTRKGPRGIFRLRARLRLVLEKESQCDAAASMAGGIV